MEIGIIGLSISAVSGNKFELGLVQRNLYNIYMLTNSLECIPYIQLMLETKPREVLNFELGMDVRPEVSTTTL